MLADFTGWHKGTSHMNSSYPKLVQGSQNEYKLTNMNTSYPIWIQAIQYYYTLAIMN